MTDDARRLARLAERAAARAGAFLLTATAPEAAQWTAKGHHDFVTEVDRTAERRIAEDLLRAEPGSRILGEELSPAGVDLAGLVWVVDPLDGTANYLHGYPWWSVSIAAAVDGDLVAGTVLNVAAHRHYTAWQGGGAWCGPDRLGVSAVGEASLALLGTGFPFKALEQLPRYLEILRAVIPLTSGVRRTGSAALDLAAVAQGQFDAFWEMQLAPWDIAAGIVLIREAGGIVTDLTGRPAEVCQTGLVAGNPWMHEWMLRQISRERLVNCDG
jgi:myo-inositol-1(or 4)-monophosphatase